MADTTPIDRDTLTARLNDRAPHGVDLACYDGWLDLIDRLDRDLAELDPGYRVLQVKEKFGGLRYYVRSDLADQTAFAARIAAAEEESFRTCEVTGNPGVLAVSGNWYAARDLADPSAIDYRVARDPRPRRQLVALTAAVDEPAEGRIEGLSSLADGLLDRVEQLEAALDRCRTELDTLQGPAAD